jgi:molecular chaperone DnaJ
MQVSPHVTVNGGEQRIAIHRSARCPSCIESLRTDCVCAGEGRVKIREVITVKLAPGAVTGAQIRVTGKGTDSLDDGPHGDLILSLESLPVVGFRRDGIDLHGVFSVSRDLLASGGLADVQLPRGPVKLKVPANTRLGDRFRLRSQGLDEWCGEERGDVYLTVREG